VKAAPGGCLRCHLPMPHCPVCLLVETLYLLLTAGHMPLSIAHRPASSRLFTPSVHQLHAVQALPVPKDAGWKCAGGQNRIMHEC